MTAVRAVRVAAVSPGSPVGHVFGDRVADAEACRLAERVDVAFLAEAGWDAGTQVLRPPAGHPLLGRPVCLAPECGMTAPARDRFCIGCRARLARHGLGPEDLDRLPPSRRAAARDADRLARLAAVEDLCLVAAL